ncbi:DUF7261 family protein [Halorussus halophilus]|uniref:DUF7261 family protein n=1 Tax=Halorussus halophilus TaxID=2650975 RepID=UPI001300F2EE|nr:hypothetical protein [Halorussus halophilus]
MSLDRAETADAVALAPVVFAYLQLGYHGDVTASEDYTSPGRNAERVLERAVHEASVETRGEYAWTDRDLAVSEVRSELEPRVNSLRSSRVESGTAYRVSYNQSAAQAWRQDNCLSGSNRDFGGCIVRQGVVVQERAGETHVLAVAFYVRVTTERGTTELTILVRPVGR